MKSDGRGYSNRGAARIMDRVMPRVARAISLLIVSVLTIEVARAAADTSDYSVQVSSVVAVTPPAITLNWPQDTRGVPTSYTIYRKAPTDQSWGAGQTLPGNATTYVDHEVAIGRAYEYRLVKAAASYTGYGYVQTGIDVPLVEDRGTVLLIVDRTHAGTLAAELSRLQQDLIGDGWTVWRRDVGRNDPVASVKALIKTAYDADPVRVKSVFLFGHVPVPYSGQLNPDKHPDHVGAWPADVYYGDMHGSWTDTTVNYRQTLNADAADAARLSNIPGDGKFDQSTIPGTVELQVGRVDLANLPGRAGESGRSTFLGEAELLRQYLNKDHNFRHGRLNVPRRALIGDSFGLRGGEAFSASGYRSFAPLVGPQNITNVSPAANPAKIPWISAVSARNYLLAYGCGPGSYRTIEGLGTTGPARDCASVDLISADIQAVFTLIFGSWLGDWDQEDNFMRSILAAPTCSLATAWSGRPHWFVHPLGLGETIGYTTRLAQNNRGLYQNQINQSANQVHVALMGDPTLRLHPVAPVGAFGGTSTSVGTRLDWNPSPESVTGYHVYRSSEGSARFTRLTAAPTTAASFFDSHSVPGATYMVRAVKREVTPSGSYFNASQGLFWTADEPFPLNGTIASSGKSTISEAEAPSLQPQGRTADL